MYSRSARPVVLVVVVLASFAAAFGGAACAEDRESGLLPPDGGADAAAGITILTHVPVPGAGSGSGASGAMMGAVTGAKASATWAAFSTDDGPWQVLAPIDVGTYALGLPAARWAVAIVCANDDDAKTAVLVYRRTLATRSLDVALAEQCTPFVDGDELTLTGNITNAPATTEWLDFGYARDSRGVAIPVPTSGSSPYELVGIEAGRWDLSFAVRDQPFRAPSRIVIRRDEALTADRAMDIDVMGPASFVPGSNRFALHAIGVGDSVQPMIFYGAGGPLGIDLGPQDVPADQTDVALAYSTVPEASQRPTDRYHGDIRVQHDRRTDERTIVFDLHAALDLDLTLLPPIEAPRVTAIGGSPLVRLETRSGTVPNASAYEIRAVSSLNRRTEHVWRTTYDSAAVAAASELVDVMPDLSALPGFKSTWSLPRGTGATVFVTALEAPQPLGDGTLQRTTAKAASIVP